MKKYRLYGVVTAGKYLGEIEAESVEAAVEKARDLDSCFVSICHQCSEECSDPEITEITADEIE